MVKKISLTAVAILILFFGYVSTKKSEFHYEQSGTINAPPGTIFPYISDFHKGGSWSPYEKMDPEMKKTFSGPDATVGSTMEFEGANGKAGSGRLEILKIVPDQLVEIKLTMTKPFHAENIIDYTLTPEGSGTKFTWAMSGDGGFMGKLMATFIDCQAMVEGQFKEGISNLQQIIEQSKK